MVQEFPTVSVLGGVYPIFQQCWAPVAGQPEAARAVRAAFTEHVMPFSRLVSHL